MAVAGALAVTIFAVHGIGAADSSPAVSATSVIPSATSGGARPVATAAISTSGATHSAAAVPAVSATPSLSNAPAAPPFSGAPWIPRPAPPLLKIRLGSPWPCSS